MATLRAGSIVRYQANVVVPLMPTSIWTAPPGWETVKLQATKAAIQGQIQQMANAKSASLTGYVASFNDDGNGNIQVNIRTNIDRNSTEDLRYDMDSAVQAAGAQIRGSAIQLTSPGGNVPGTIPAPIQGDTYHDRDTVLGTAGQFWLDQVGQQFQGLVQGLASGGPMMWLGIGVVALIFFSRK